MSINDNGKPKVKAIKKPIPVQVKVKEKSNRTQPKFKLEMEDNSVTKSRTGQLPSMPKRGMNIPNNCGSFRRNIVTLKLDRSDVRKLEELMSNSNNILLDNIRDPFDPKAWDPNNNTSLSIKQDRKPSECSGSSGSLESTGGARKLGALGNLAKRIKKSESKTSTKSSLIAEDRKNLIINSGVKRSVTHAVHVTGDPWPSSTDKACMYCCHRFDNTPVGIPYAIINNKFMCYGNFCSYNCAKRYLCPNHDDEDDMAAIQTYSDLYVGDEQGEKLQLLELLFHIETDAPIEESIKPAPKRLILRLWGGHKTIDEYRESFYTNTTFHVFKTPIASMGYQIEECSDTRHDSKRTLRNLSLDVDKLDRARQELLKVKNNIRKELNVRQN